MSIRVLTLIAVLLATRAMAVPTWQGSRLGQRSKYHAKQEAPIFVAIQKRDLVELRKLVAAGANLEARSNDGFTPIMWTAYGYGDTRIGPIIDLLIEKGADINAKTKDGQTALMWAARDGNLIAAMALINAKADLNVKDSYSSAAIHYCANWAQYDFIMIGKEESQAGIAAAIVDGGGDPNLRDAKGRTALMWACAQGHDNVVRELSAKSDLSLQDEFGRTALTMATWHGKDSEEIKLLLNAGAKLRFVDALALEDVDAARKLSLDSDALTARGPHLESTLLLAAKIGADDLVSELIKKGADPCAIDNRGFSAVMLATGVTVGAGQMGLYWNSKPNRNGREETIRVLAKAGANVNHVVLEQDTLVSAFAKGFGALAFAVHDQNVSMVKTLLELGASPNGSWVKGVYNDVDPLAIAVNSKNFAIVKMLLEAGTNPNAFGVLLDAISPNQYGEFASIKVTPKQRIAMIQLLLNYGANPNQFGEYGESPLSTAIDENDPAMVEVLIAKYANVRSFDPFNGESMLIKAVRVNNPEIVKLLLARGADPALKSPRGFTARWLAESKGFKAIAEILLKAEQKVAAKKVVKPSSSP